MRGLVPRINALGITINKFIHLADVSFHTLKKLDAGGPLGVRPDIVARVHSTLARLEAEQANNTASERKAGGG